VTHGDWPGGGPGDRTVTARYGPFRVRRGEVRVTGSSESLDSVNLNLEPLSPTVRVVMHTAAAHCQSRWMQAGRRASESDWRQTEPETVP
jgi:hypothetical protein